MRNITVFLLLLMAPAVVFGHGKLTNPVARGGVGYENDPIGANDGTIFTATETEAWVCRHEYNDNHDITATWNANSFETVQWHNSAAHVGDCELYLSPDYDSPLRDMRWFKIASYYDCKQHSQTPVNLWVPSWVPEGRYVLRWGWYALHNWPSGLEFFVQCADIQINNAGVTTFPTELQMYSFLEPNTLYPYSGQRVVDGEVINNYRHPFPPSTDTYTTGPSCALCWTLDDCEKDGHQAIMNGCENAVSSTHGFLWPVGVEIDGFVDVIDEGDQSTYCNTFQCSANTLQIEYAAAVVCQHDGCTQELCCVPKVHGCTNPAATNYNAGANVDDGSCVVETVDPNAPTEPVPTVVGGDLYDSTGLFHGCTTGVFVATSTRASDEWCQADCVWSWNHCKDFCGCNGQVVDEQGVTVTTTEYVDPNCNSGLYLAKDARATDEWCQTTCENQPEWCMEYCSCSDDVNIVTDGPTEGCQKYVAFDARATDEWCEANCAVSVDFCSVYCACEGDVPQDPDCPSQSYYNLDNFATVEWCQNNCPYNWAYCSPYCGCNHGATAQTTQPEVTTQVEVETTQPEATTTEAEVQTTEPEVTTTEVEETTQPEVTTTEVEETTQPEVTTTEVEETTQPEVTTTEVTTTTTQVEVPVDDTVVQEVLDLLTAAQNNDVFQYEKPDLTWAPSDIYLWEDMIEAVRLVATRGVAGLKLWVSDPNQNKPEYGMVNIAAFLANAMQETIRYNACDENNWSGSQTANKFGGVTYSAASACGQANQSYQDYQCSPEEDELAGGKMACDYDPNMEIRARTQAKWYGAPPALFCAPKSKVPKAPRWDYMTPWCAPEGGWGHITPFPADIPLDQYFEYVMQGGSCKDYEGIQTGGWKFTGQGCTDEGCAGSPAPLFGQPEGRTDVEGCCWWGRGVIQTTGTCNFGKLNYYIGKRAADEGRDALYPTINFCETPDAICDPDSPKELKWIAGFFYWLNAVQPYEQGGWNYQEELKKWVDNGMNLQDTGFINGASGIVNRGCHNPPNCGTGTLHGGAERRANFEMVLAAMQL